MGYKDKTYVIFDGDKDQWAYRFMRGWKKNDNIDFDFEDAHDLFPLTYRAQDENYIKSKLRERFKATNQVIILIGESTKHLYKYVRWELEIAIELKLPIIVVNINEMRNRDFDRCPAIIREYGAIHIPFKMRIIKYAMDHFPSYFSRNSAKAWYYGEEIYKSLDL